MSAVFKLILFIIITIALYLEIFINGVIIQGAFYYFTIQSNILVAFCLLIFIPMNKNNRFKCLIRGSALLAIMLTGIIYNFVLYRIYLDWGTVGYTFSRTVTHVVAPIGFIIDWLLFDKHNVMRWKDIFIWLTYPVAYCLLSLYANFRYDYSIYFFLNMSNGYGNALKWLGILMGLLLIISFSLVALDRCVVCKGKVECTL